MFYGINPVKYPSFQYLWKVKHFDYIFTGVGLSALMTVYEMLVSGKFEDKSILLIDENAKCGHFKVLQE